MTEGEANAGSAVRAFWRELDSLRRQRGFSYKQLERRTKIPHSTLQYWMARSGRLVGWLRVRDVVLALEAPESVWFDRWKRADGSAVNGRPDGDRPSELPPDVSGFTGRRHQLDALDRMLTVDTASAVVISAVSGTAGVGKSALAVHWAHRARHRFPDGVLHADLRGFHPSGRPAQPAEVLERFLRGLGVAGKDVPEDLPGRIARFRTAVAERRMLVILDNARGADHVRDLLPGTPSCFVLVTSRDRLAGLVARDGARRLDLDVLPAAEAMELLRTLAGHRVAAEPAAAADLIDRCARLPLAVRIAAEVIASRPSLSLADLVAELDRNRLDVLDAGGDEHTAVRSVISWSYRHLSPDEARCFRLLGVHPGDDIEPYAVAALMDSDLDGARKLLDALISGHLIHETSPGRFGMHDLLRSYARELPSPGTDDREAFSRLFRHHLGTAVAAIDLVLPWDHHPYAAEVATPAPDFASADEAMAWLDAERANLILGAEYAACHGWPNHTTDLSAVIHRYLDLGAHYREAETLHRRAVMAAERVDRATLGRALVSLGNIRWRLGNSVEAHEHHNRGLAAARAAGDRPGEGRAQHNLGLVCEHLSRYPEALEHFRQAVAICRETGDRVGESRSLDNLGVVYWRLGRAADALHHHQRSLAVARDIGDRVGQSRAQGNMALALEQLGRLAEARDLQLRTLDLGREIGDRALEAITLINLGTIHFKLGRYAEALEYQTDALTIGREISHNQIEAAALNDGGLTLCRMGAIDRAAKQHRQALVISRDRGDRLAEGQALDGLGRAYRKAGDDDGARAMWTQALAIFTSLGVPEADEVRRRLRGCAGDGEEQDDQDGEDA